MASSRRRWNSTQEFFAFSAGRFRNRHSEPGELDQAGPVIFGNAYIVQVRQCPRHDVGTATQEWQRGRGQKTWKALSFLADHESPESRC